MGGGYKSLVPLISISVRDIYRDHLSDAAHAHQGRRRSAGLFALELLPCVPPIPRRQTHGLGAGVNAELWGGWGPRRATRNGTFSTGLLLIVAVWAFDIVTVEGEGCSASAGEGGRGSGEISVDGVKLQG